MKYLPILIIPLVLYVVGLMSGPMVGSWFVDEAVEDTTLKEDVKINGVKFHIDLAEMRDNELPGTVRTVGSVDLPTVVGDGMKSLADGREVKLLNRNEKKLIIQTVDGSAKGEVDIKQTDIFATIARRKMDELRAASGNQPAPVTPPVAEPPVKEPILAQNPNPAPPVQPNMPGPQPVPVPQPEPEPEPTAAAALTSDQIVEVMKKSIAGGAVKEFTSDQVEAWKAGEDEEIDGEDYQTGLVAYKAKTIFGEQTVQAKALVQGGKVARWVYAKTGMEIR